MNTDSLSSEKPYDLTFQDRNGYLYAYVKGEIDNVEVSFGYWREIVKKCKDTGAEKLLVEENLPGNLSETDAYHLASALPKLGFYRIKIAFVDRHVNQQDINRFAEMVAVNRGIHGKIFNDADEAEKWLLPGI